MSEPVFSTLLHTQERQRLDGLAQGHTVLEQLDLVIDDARAEFWTRLGLTRLDEVAAMTAAEPPVTEDNYMHLLASTTEQKMIRKGLLSWVSIIAKEGGGGRIHQEWNDVSAFRDKSVESMQGEQDILAEQINQAFDILSGNSDAGSAPRVKASAIGSQLDDQYRKVGFSLWANPPYLFHFALDDSNE